MNVFYGGKQETPRESKIPTDPEAAALYLGPHNPQLKPGDTHYTSVNGTVICPVEDTRAIWCTGRGDPCTSFMPKESLDEYGYICVNKHCQARLGRRCSPIRGADSPSLHLTHSSAWSLTHL